MYLQLIPPSLPWLNRYMFGLKAAYLGESRDVWGKTSAERGAQWQDWAWKREGVCFSMPDDDTWLQLYTCCQMLLAPFAECDSLLVGTRKFSTGSPLQLQCESLSSQILVSGSVLWQETALRFYSAASWALVRSRTIFHNSHLLLRKPARFPPVAGEVRSASFGSTRPV